MSDTHYIKIKEKYIAGDSIDLFKYIQSIEFEIGFDSALLYLETCAKEKRLIWLEKQLPDITLSEDPLMDAYKIFYEMYLGFSIPRDGEITEKTEKKLVMRWYNHCPTFEACNKLGMDTREICKKVYQNPVREFLVRINPGLRFERNYNSIRPYTDYCEEMIFLE